MDIGTAKPTREQQKFVKHWMIDIIDPNQQFSCFQFTIEAKKIIKKRSNANMPILICGGSGLYFDGLSKGIGTVVEPCMELRKKYQEKIQSHGKEAVFKELEQIDPITAFSSHPSNIKRNIRALEVFHTTGIPISKLKTQAAPPADMDFLIIICMLHRQDLYRRIENRVDSMFNNGLLKEFITLRDSGYDETSPGMQSVGYRELFALEKKALSFDSVVETIKMHTRQYAKRQITWFRHQAKGQELNMSEFEYSRVKKTLTEFLSQES